MLIGFFLLWIILCGNVTLEILIFDLIVTCAVFWFTCRFCYWSVEREKTFLRLVLPGLRYIGLLIIEIVKANAAMLRLVLRPGFQKQAQPMLVKVHVPLQTNIAKMTLANSITLTPGTITVETRGTDFVVHCFNPAFSEGMDSSVLVDALLKMETIAGHGKEAA